MIVALVRKIFWIALFLVFTLCFVALFEHGWNGTDAFVKDVQTEFDGLTKFFGSPIKREKDQSDKLGQ